MWRDGAETVTKSAPRYDEALVQPGMPRKGAPRAEAWLQRRG